MAGERNAPRAALDVQNHPTILETTVTPLLAFYIVAGTASISALDPLAGVIHGFIPGVDQGHVSCEPAP
jgi:hypothetical protein